MMMTDNINYVNNDSTKLSTDPNIIYIKVIKPDPYNWTEENNSQVSESNEKWKLEAKWQELKKKIYRVVL